MRRTVLLLVVVFATLLALTSAAAPASTPQHDPTQPAPKGYVKATVVSVEELAKYAPKTNGQAAPESKAPTPITSKQPGWQDAAVAHSIQKNVTKEDAAMDAATHTPAPNTTTSAAATPLNNTKGWQDAAVVHDLKGQGVVEAEVVETEPVVPRKRGWQDAAAANTLQAQEKKDVASNATTAAAVSKSVEKFVSLLQTKIGASYKSGAKGPKEFDSAGLVAWAAKEAGFKDELPSTVEGLFKVGSNVMRPTDRKPGDVLFFARSTASGEGKPFHVGVYLAANKMIHAPDMKSKVRIENYSNWPGQMKTARRLFN